MTRDMRPTFLRLLAAPSLFTAALSSQAFNVNDQLSADGFILGAGQCQNVTALLPGATYGEVLDDTVAPPLLDNSMDKLGNECAGAIPFQLELSYHPDDYNEFFAVIGFAAGNGLADSSPWILSPFAADLEDDVQNINGSNRDYLLVAGYRHVSLDQEFGDVVGGFLRFAWQKEDAAIDYKALYSGGLNFSGNGWGRESDNIGVGYAYLPGGNLDVDNSHVFEAYYRAGLNEYAALSADVQYMKDDLEKIDPHQDDPSGWIFGLRLTAEF